MNRLKLIPKMMIATVTAISTGLRPSRSASSPDTGMQTAKNRTAINCILMNVVGAIPRLVTCSAVDFLVPYELAHAVIR